MIKEVSNELIQIVKNTADKLKRIDEMEARTKPNPQKWSIQEILGHLVDSAANNHQRFVRAQEVEELVFPGYAQDHWVRVQSYNETSWEDLVELWQLYNLHLAHVITRLPEEKLSMKCKIGQSEPITLEYLAEDYVAHLKHHLKQIEEKSSA